MTALHIAAAAGHKDMVILLLTAGLDVDAEDSMRMTPLHWSSECGHEEVIRALFVGLTTYVSG